MLKIALIVIIIIKYRTNIFRISISIVVYIKFNILLRSWLDLSIKNLDIYI